MPVAASGNASGQDAPSSGTKAASHHGSSLTVSTNGSATDREKDDDLTSGSTNDKVTMKKSHLLGAQKGGNSAASSPRMYATASPRTYKRKRDSIEDDDSDEEALWNRAMKQAEKLAQWEHSETVQARKAAEQAALNESFFSRSSKKDDSDLGVDVSANLLLEADFDDNDLAIMRAEKLHKLLQEARMNFHARMPAFFKLVHACIPALLSTPRHAAGVLTSAYHHS